MPQVVPLRTDAPLRPAPIEPAWIIEGDPVAHNCVLSRGSDGLALTILWECTEGAFDWHYDYDETVHFLEGSVVIESATMAPTRFGPAMCYFFLAVEYFIGLTAPAESVQAYFYAVGNQNPFRAPPAVSGPFGSNGAMSRSTPPASLNRPRPTSTAPRRIGCSKTME